MNQSIKRKLLLVQLKKDKRHESNSFSSWETWSTTSNNLSWSTPKLSVKMQKDNDNESDQESVFANPHGILSGDDEESDMNSDIIDIKRCENEDCAVNEKDEDLNSCNVENITQETLDRLITKIHKARSEIRELQHEKDAMCLERRIFRDNKTLLNETARHASPNYGANLNIEDKVLHVEMKIEEILEILSKDKSPSCKIILKQCKIAEHYFATLDKLESSNCEHIDSDSASESDSDSSDSSDSDCDYCVDHSMT